MNENRTRWTWKRILAYSRASWWWRRRWQSSAHHRWRRQSRAARRWRTSAASPWRTEVNDSRLTAARSPSWTTTSACRRTPENDNNGEKLLMVPPSAEIVIKDRWISQSETSMTTIRDVVNIILRTACSAGYRQWKHHFTSILDYC